MDLEVQKASIIEQLKQVNASDLITAIKSILDFAKEKEQKVYNIPESLQNLVMERFKKTREYPDRLLDWNEAKKKLNAL